MRQHKALTHFLIKRFADKHRVVVADRQGENECLEDAGRRRGGPFVSNDYYTIRDLPDPYAIEHALQKTEDWGTEAIRHVIDKHNIADLEEYKLHLSVFFAFLFVRGDAVRRILVEQMRQAAFLTSEISKGCTSSAFVETNVVYDPCNVLWNTPNPNRASRLPMAKVAQHITTSNGDLDIEVTHHEKLHLSIMRDVIEELVPLFQNRDWSVLEFPENALIIGDEPICLLGLDRRPGIEPLGLTANQIVVPVDPRHAFLLSFPRRGHLIKNVTKKNWQAIAGIINTNLAYGCQEIVVWNPTMDNPLKGRKVPLSSRAVYIVDDIVVTHVRPTKIIPT